MSLSPNPKPSIEIDTSQALLVVVRFHYGPSDDEFRQYLRDYGAVLDRERRMAAVYVTDAGMPLTPARQVRLQAQFMKERQAMIEERVVGIAFALSNPLMRGALRAVLMLQPMPCQHVVVGTEAEGVAWAKSRLWSDHLRRIKGSAP